MPNTVEPAIAPFRSLSATFPQPVTAADSRFSDSVSIPSVWREVIGTLSSHSAPILANAFLGYALAGILAALLATAMLVGIYQQDHTLIMTYGPSRIVPLIVEAVIGMMTGVYARGAITCLVLRRQRNTASLRLASLPFLFLMLLVLGGLLYVGNIGLSMLFNAMQLDLAEGGIVSLSLGGIGRSIALRSISTLIPDPGAPFTQLLTYVRLESTRVSTNLIYAGGFSFYRVKTVQEIQFPWLVGVASALLLLLADTLFRFGFAGIISSPRQNLWQAFAGTLRLAGRNFGLVLTHTWIVRFSIFMLSTFFVTVPMILVQSTLFPLVTRTIGGPLPYLVSNIVSVVSISLVSMVFTAFSVVYDTCLYHRLAICSE